MNHLQLSAIVLSQTPIASVLSIRTGEWIAVALIVAAAVFYLIRHFVSSRRDPCKGCAAAELCRNCEKKNEKFGRKKDFR